MSPCEEEERQRRGSSVSPATLLKPWLFLGTVPLGPLYIIFVTAALMVAYVCAVLALYQLPGIAEGRQWDAVTVGVACLVPPLSLWLSFWCVGYAVQRGASPSYGYLPVVITLVANLVLLLTIHLRDPGEGHVALLSLVILVIWLMEVCVVVNPYNCVCALASVVSKGDTGGLAAFFSDEKASPELGLVHVYIPPGVYAMAVSAAGVLIMIPEFIWLSSGWVKHAEAFQGEVFCVAGRDFFLAAGTAASLLWYNSSMGFLRRVAAEAPPPKPEERESCTLQIQDISEHSENLLSFYLPNGRLGARGNCANGGFVDELASRFDELLAKTEEVVRSSPCYRFRNAAAMPDPPTFEKFLSDIGRDVAEHYLIPAVRTALESFEAVTSRSRENTALQILCDEELDIVPWELLLLRGKFLCREFPMVRVRSVGQPSPGPTGKPHCVVVGASAQEGSDRFVELPDVEKEVNSVCNNLTEAGWKVTSLKDEDATIDNLRSVFADSDRVDVFHFTGHSEFRPSDLEHSFLRLFNDARLYASRLIDLMRIKGPWLAFLNSCESARSGFSTNAVRGLTNAMNEADVHYVVGMRWPITSTAGIVLASSFYKHLTRNYVPELALWKARIEAALSNEYDDPSWGAPCLYRN